jgi:hypothetical protein
MLITTGSLYDDIEEVPYEEVEWFVNLSSINAWDYLASCVFIDR